MEVSPTALAKLLVPKTPFILKTALAHSLYLSPTSSKWDIRTELTVKILRDMIGPNSKPTSITKNQQITTKDPGIKGKVWVSKVAFSVPESDGDDVRRAVLSACRELGNGEEKWDEPAARTVEAEWTGYRAGVGNDEPAPPNLSPADAYANLVKETESKVTVLYFHGGAMYLLDPVTYRPITSRIAKETGGRVLSVRYRLAPQNPFPAALLDALIAYLGLLYPPEGSPHAPIPASEIVWGGDSAGGMLCTALLQLVLQIHRSNPDKSSLPKIRWHGKDVQLPLPAGLALTSPWLDVTRSLPSIESLAKYDYLPTRAQTEGMKFPPCEAWPANPPRADLYADGSALMHPLVSPLMANDWTHSPPILFSLGEEMLRDEDAVVAKRMARQGVHVVWREFETMPHVFSAMLEHTAASRLHYEEYAAFCRKVVEGTVEKGGWDGEIILAKTLKRVPRGSDELTQLEDDEVETLCSEGMERIKKKHGDAAAEIKPML